jgi:lipopolysaccharide heptosyltransferase II
VRGRGARLTLTDPRLSRIVVVKPCCAGDVLMATPTIAALRRALPDAHIAVAVGEHSRPLLANNPRINELIATPTDLSARALARRLRPGRFGAALVLDRSPVLIFAPYLARIPVRSGLDSANRGLALTHPVPCPPSMRRHEVEWYLDVARALGVPAPRSESYLEFYPTEADRAEAGRVLSEAGDEGSEAGYVALHVGGGSNPGMRLLSKRWQPERWARVADWLAETYEATVLLLGGPGPEDRDSAAALSAALHPATRPYVVNLVGKLDWGPTGALIERCALFLGHDTGAMHLATAVRTPVVAVFGPSDPARYGPWDPSRRSVAVAPVQPTATGAEALRQAARAEGELYHDAVTVEGVWQAIEKIYARNLSRVPL